MRSLDVVVEQDAETKRDVGYVPGWPRNHSQADTLDELHLGHVPLIKYFLPTIFIPLDTNCTKHSIKYITISLSYLILTGVLGCNPIYRPPNIESLTPGKIGILDNTNPTLSPVFITKIDGKSSGSAIFFEFLPGEHSISCKGSFYYNYSVYRYTSDEKTIWFVVKPSVTYVLRGALDQKMGTWDAWIINKETRERVDYIK